VPFVSSRVGGVASTPWGCGNGGRAGECQGVGVPVSAGWGGVVGWAELVGDLAERVGQGMNLAAFPAGAHPSGVDVVAQRPAGRVGVPGVARDRLRTTIVCGQVARLPGRIPTFG